MCATVYRRDAVLLALGTLDPAVDQVAVVTVDRVQHVFKNRVFEAAGDGAAETAPSGWAGSISREVLGRAGECGSPAWYTGRCFPSVHIGALALSDRVEGGTAAGAKPEAPAVGGEEAVSSAGAVGGTPPLVSVLVPAFNAAETIGEAVRSILDQSMSDLELVVVDDASADDTAAVASARAAGDPRLRIVRRGENGGVAAALNTGLAHCRGRFVARMDADDVSLPDRLAVQVRFLLDHPEVDLCGSAVQMVASTADSDRVGYGRVVMQPTHPVLLRFRMMLGCALNHPTIMARVAFFQSRAYPSAFPSAEDYALWLQALWPRAGGRAAVCANLGVPLLLLRRHGGNVSGSCRQRLSSAQALARVCRRLLPALEGASGAAEAAGDEAVPEPAGQPAVRAAYVLLYGCQHPDRSSNEVNDPDGSIRLVSSLERSLSASDAEAAADALEAAAAEAVAGVEADGWGGPAGVAARGGPAAASSAWLDRRHGTLMAGVSAKALARQVDGEVTSQVGAWAAAAASSLPGSAARLMLKWRMRAMRR